MTALAGMLQDEILRYAYVYGDVFAVGVAVIVCCVTVTFLPIVPRRWEGIEARTEGTAPQNP